MDNPFKSPNVLSLCTGMRGLERGLERVIGNFTTVAYVEIEAFIIENLVRQMEQGVLAPAPVWSNLKTFRWEMLRGKVDFFLGGYPCQPFSVSGAQKGEADPRHLFPYIEQGITIIRPRACFFENVANHLNIGYETVRRKLQDLGYRVEEGIFSAEEVGAPHKRERMFILAILDDSSSNGFEQVNKIQARRNGTELTGKKLANTDGGRMHESCQELESKQFGSNGLEGRIKLADTYCKGSQKRGIKPTQQKLSSFIRSGEFGVWPAKPGNPQHEWEEPRTVKSGMGFTINGYNFREDLLRMAGNGVVEQTAELAFIELLKKHGII